jgi:hypothetical protein
MLSPFQPIDTFDLWTPALAEDGIIRLPTRTFSSPQRAAFDMQPPRSGAATAQSGEPLLSTTATATICGAAR